MAFTMHESGKKDMIYYYLTSVGPYNPFMFGPYILSQTRERGKGRGMGGEVVKGGKGKRNEWGRGKREAE